MKKIIAVAALSIFALASCKKDYTCECKFTGTVTGSATTTINASKKDAKKACEADNSSSNGQTTTCSIK